MSIERVLSKRDGSVRYVVRASRSGDGKRNRKRAGSFTTIKAAKAKERELLTKSDRGIDIATKQMTVEQLLDAYIGKRRRIGIKSLERYREMVKNQIVPYLGSKKADSLKRADISELIGILEKKGNKRNGLGLAAKSIKHTVRLLSSAFGWGVDMEYVLRNPAHGFSMELTTDKPAQPKAIEADEARRLLVAAESEGGLWVHLFTLSLSIGARRGEVLALKWSDVDWDAETVTIERALSQTKSEGVIVKCTKTGKVRCVRLSANALSALRKHRAAQNVEKLAAGEYYDDNEWIFALASGRRINPTSVSNAFHRIATKAGISTTRLHDMRHTFASWLLASGENIETVKDALGHSTSYTTLTTYGHATKRASSAAVHCIDERLAGLGPTSGPLLENAKEKAL